MILTYLDLSTGHLTQDTMDRIGHAADLERDGRYNPDGWPAMSIGCYRHGVFLTVPDPDEQNLFGVPRDLFNVLRYAQDMGIPLLRFDGDARAVPGLPLYEET